MSVYIRRFSELPYRESNSSGQGVSIRIISGNRETITASCKLSKSQVRVDRRTLNINGIGVRINGLGLNYRTGRVDDLSGNAGDLAAGREGSGDVATIAVGDRGGCHGYASGQAGNGFRLDRETLALFSFDRRMKTIFSPDPLFISLLCKQRHIFFVSIAHANNYSMAEALLTSRLIFHKMPKTIGIILLDFFCDTWYK